MAFVDYEVGAETVWEINLFFFSKRSVVFMQGYVRFAVSGCTEKAMKSEDKLANVTFETVTGQCIDGL